MSRLPGFIICGIVRNGGDALSKTLVAIDSIRDSAERSVCLIVTNDNSDNTSAILHEWGALRSGTELVLLEGIARAYPDRVDRIAFARNAYLSLIFDDRFDKFPFVLIVDLDGPNINIRPEDIFVALSAAPEWDALFANQRQCYYDLYALRHGAWCPRDCWEEVAEAITLPFRNRKQRLAIQNLIHDRQFHIPCAVAPIPVLSAFGGMAIYRRNVLQGCWYGSRDGNGKVVCEHVILHEQLRAKGAKLFIAPGLLNDAPHDHLGPTSGRPFPPGYRGAGLRTLY